VDVASSPVDASPSRGSALPTHVESTPDVSASAPSALSALPTPPWRRTVRREEPPKRQISQNLILQTSLEVIRAEGLDALSIRRIAQQLKIGPATVYVHFANKNELLELALDEVLSAVAVPEPDPVDWPQQVAQVARAMYQELITCGDLARASLGRVSIGPNALRVTEGLIAIMVGGGVPVQLAVWAKDRLWLYVHADAYEGSQFAAHQRKYGEQGVRTFRNQVGTYYAELPPAQFPMLSKNAAALVTGSCDDRFELGLGLLIDGLAARVSPDPTPTRTPPGRRP
jgi:AcrR family transcriptional regulator